MVIKAPKTDLRQFWVLLLFLRFPGHNCIMWYCSRLEGFWGVRRLQINDHGLSDVIIVLVLHNDHRGIILTSYEPAELNMGLWTPMNPQQLGDIINLAVDQDPSEWLTNLLDHQDYLKLQFETLHYHLNNNRTHQNPPEPFSSIKDPPWTLTLQF